MHQPESTETARARSCTGQVGNEELVGISHDHMADFAPPIDEQTQLTPQFAG